MNAFANVPASDVDRDQPIGPPLDGWTPCPLPGNDLEPTERVRLEPLVAARHAAELDRANRADDRDRMWTYLGYGPFATADDYVAWVRSVETSIDPKFYAIIDRRDERSAGIAAYLRIRPQVGVIEIGHLAFAPRLQRTAAASEAVIQMARYAFRLGYRRIEWKCDALNAPSRSAALRFGFRYEGTFRQATIVKGRNRDTAWFAMIDADRAALVAAWSAWSAPENFDADGRQRRSLRDWTAPLVGET
ncbi:MAG TPA: GNAT family N-acetyltransferase [Planctomycetaceae bacterium]|nr:GNAT family N-acetyltransferase [Planctomycetaceae bacterium]HRE99453.1 GNAT family protein [Pirellulaceae bacterium]